MPHCSAERERKHKSHLGGNNGTAERMKPSLHSGPTKTGLHGCCEGTEAQ